MMNPESLRQKHPVFEYRAYSYQVSGGQLEIDYDFRMEPGIEFHPHITMPYRSDTAIEALVFNLGLVEAISYWKSACAPVLRIKAGRLGDKQIGWWHRLYLRGLGEFYYRNKIDFTKRDFLRFETHPVAPSHMVSEAHLSGLLVPVGGGKDSVVTLELLRERYNVQVLALNPTEAALGVIRTAGIDNPIIVRRDIDKKLLDLNAAGYLNGHTPFSAYLSFIGVLAAFVNGYSDLAVSNEDDSSEGNIKFHGIEINHQYSKSWEFEELFREYCRENLTGNVSYFSLLRPLTESQISALFTRTVKYDPIFKSCNAGRGKAWCRKCPKCAFVYLMLSQFISLSRLRRIFGHQELFDTPQIISYIRQLTGFEEHKPFECVGTVAQSRQAVATTIMNRKRNNEKIPESLTQIARQLQVEEMTAGNFQDALRSGWNGSHNLTPDFEKIVKDAVGKIEI